MFGPAVRGVDKDKIEIAQLGLGEGGVDKLVRVLVAEGVTADGNLGGEEDLRTRDGRGVEAGGAVALVAV